MCRDIEDGTRGGGLAFLTGLLYNRQARGRMVGMPGKCGAVKLYTMFDIYFVCTICYERLFLLALFVMATFPLSLLFRP